MKMNKKKKFKIERTKQFEGDLKQFSPKDREHIEEVIKKIAKNPYIGEPTKPCPKCDEYFFHSDGKCPFCGVAVKGD